MRNLFLAICLLAAFAANAQSDRKSRTAPLGLGFKHSINFTPFSGIVAYNEINPGIGFDYEYILSPENGIGLYFPFAFGFPGPDYDYYGDYRHTTAYAAPGIRFHTAKKGSNVDFATGPGILIGNMHFRPTDNYYGQNPNITRGSYDYGMLGLVVNNSLNFYRKNFQFGFDVRLGTLLEQRENTRFFIHFGMHFGGIF